MEAVNFSIPSISCSSCSSKIQDGIKGLRGVNNVSVDMKTQNVRVEYNPGEIQPQDIKKAISGMGYEVMQ